MRQRHFLRNVLIPPAVLLLFIVVLGYFPLPLPYKWTSAALFIAAIVLYLSRLQKFWGNAADVVLEARRWGWLFWLLWLLLPLNFGFFLFVSWFHNKPGLNWIYLFTGGVSLFILLSVLLQFYRLAGEPRWRSFRGIAGMLIVALLMFSGWTGQFQFLVYFLLAIWLFKFETCQQLSGGRKALLILGSVIAFLILAANVQNSGAHANQNNIVFGKVTISSQTFDTLRLLEFNLIPFLSDILTGLRRLLMALCIVLPGRMLFRPLANWLRSALRIRTKLALSYIFSSVIPALILVVLLLFGVLFMMGGFWQLFVGDLFASSSGTLKSLWDTDLSSLRADPAVSAIAPRNDISYYFQRNDISVIFADVGGDNEITGLYCGGAVLPELTPLDSVMLKLPESIFNHSGASSVSGQITRQAPTIRFSGFVLPATIAPDSLIIRLGDENFDGLVWFDEKPYLSYWMRRGAFVTALLQPFTMNRLLAMKKRCGTDLLVVPGGRMNFRNLTDGGTSVKMGESFPPALKTESANERYGILDFPIYFPTLLPSLLWNQDEGFMNTYSVVIVKTSLFSLFRVIFSPEHLMNRIYLIALAVIAAFFGFILILVVLFGFGLVRGITRSVANIRRGTQQLRKGQLDARIQVKSRDELGELSESFNLMAADIQRMMEEVKEKERLEGELEAAKAIQLKLLPDQVPYISGYDVAAVSLPAKQVGGDYYDFLPLSGDRWGIAVGDVSGKGMPAALLMANLQASLHTLGQSDLPLEAMVAQLNTVLYQNTAPQMFATFFFAAVHPENGTIRYVNAGHNPPLVCSADVSDTLKDGGMLLGVMPEARYRVGNITLKPGEIMALYSDGITEATAGEDREYGEERLVQLLMTHCRFNAETILQAVLKDVQNYCGTPQDDVTLVIVKKLERQTQDIS